MFYRSALNEILSSSFQLCCEYVIRSRTQALLSGTNPSSSKPQRKESSQPAPVIKQEPTIKVEPPSTPENAEVMMDDDLVGTVLQLPESTNPYKIASELYSEFSSYFGDGLSARLPINTVTGYYTPIPKEDKLVQLWSEESKKSGEELLQQIMSAPMPSNPSSAHHSRGPSRMHSGANGEESDLLSLFDDGKSEVSSRSERSHSDDLSFFIDESDLTVKTTVHDPSQGVKMTLKRLKSGMDSKKSSLPPKRYTIADIFPSRRLIPQTDCSMRFFIRGSDSTQPQTKPRKYGQINEYPVSAYHHLDLKKKGKKSAMKISGKKRLQNAHRCATSLDTVL